MVRCNPKSLMSARFPELSFLCMHSLEYSCIQKSTGFRIKSSGVGSWVLPPPKVTILRHLWCLSLTLISNILC